MKERLSSGKEVSRIPILITSDIASMLKNKHGKPLTPTEEMSIMTWLNIPRQINIVVRYSGDMQPLTVGDNCITIDVFDNEICEDVVSMSGGSMKLGQMWIPKGTLSKMSTHDPIRSFPKELPNPTWHDINFLWKWVEPTTNLDWIMLPLVSNTFNDKPNASINVNTAHVDELDHAHTHCCAPCGNCAQSGCDVKGILIRGVFQDDMFVNLECCMHSTVQRALIFKYCIWVNDKYTYHRELTYGPVTHQDDQDDNCHDKVTNECLGALSEMFNHPWRPNVGITKDGKFVIISTPENLYDDFIVPTIIINTATNKPTIVTDLKECELIEARGYVPLQFNKLEKSNDPRRN